MLFKCWPQIFILSVNIPQRLIGVFGKTKRANRLQRWDCIKLIWLIFWISSLKIEIYDLLNKCYILDEHGLCFQADLRQHLEHLNPTFFFFYIFLLTLRCTFIAFVCFVLTCKGTCTVLWIWLWIRACSLCYRGSIFVPHLFASAFCRFCFGIWVKPPPRLHSGSETSERRSGRWGHHVQLHLTSFCTNWFTLCRLRFLHTFYLITQRCMKPLLRNCVCFSVFTHILNPI